MFELQSFLPLGRVDLVQILVPLPGVWIYTLVLPEPEFDPLFRNSFLQVTQKCIRLQQRNITLDANPTLFLIKLSGSPHM